MSDKEDILALVPEPETKVLEEKKPNRGHFQRKIDPAWIPDILVMAAQPNATLASVAKKVKDKWGVEITAQGIRNVIKQSKVERSEITKTVIRDNIGGYILGDLEILKQKKQELVELSVEFKTKKDWKNYFGTIDRIKTYSEMLFELSGANEKQSQDDAEAAKQELLDTLEKFQYGKGD